MIYHVGDSIRTGWRGSTNAWGKTTEQESESCRTPAYIGSLPAI